MRVWENEAASRYGSLERYYSEGLMRMFELYAPFITLIADQLPPWFVDSLPDAAVRHDYHQCVDKKPADSPGSSPAMQEMMLVRVESQKESQSFNLYVALAWLLFVLGLLPLQRSSESSNSFTPQAVGFSSSFCEVKLLHIDCCWPPHYFEQVCEHAFVLPFLYLGNTCSCRFRSSGPDRSHSHLAHYLQLVSIGNFLVSQISSAFLLV